MSDRRVSIRLQGTLKEHSSKWEAFLVFDDDGSDHGFGLCVGETAEDALDAVSVRLRQKISGEWERKVKAYGEAPASLMEDIAKECADLREFLGV